jgi:hypothetical protein
LIGRLERIGVGSAFGTAVLCLSYRIMSTGVSLRRKGGSRQQSRKCSHCRSVDTPGSLCGRVESAQKPSNEEATKAKEAIDLVRQEWKNAATRLRIQQVREQILEQDDLAFDFLALLAVGRDWIDDNTLSSLSRVSSCRPSWVPCWVSKVIG